MVVKIEQAKKPTKQQTIDWEPLLAGVANGRSRIEYGANRNIFSQGESADSLFYLREGKVKLAVTSKQGKEAIVAILGEGDFFGEGCLAGQRLRMATASTITDCSMARIEKSKMARMLRQDHSASELFVTHLLSRNVRYEADLVDQLFNSSEKRLGRKAGPKRFFPESARTIWHKWWVRRARESVIS
jgi:CRP-like cAMP-binding protein